MNLQPNWIQSPTQAREEIKRLILDNFYKDPQTQERPKNSFQRTERSISGIPKVNSSPHLLASSFALANRGATSGEFNLNLRSLLSPTTENV